MNLLDINLMFGSIIINLQELTDEDRQAFIERYKEYFCIYCGSKDVPCHCENDE